MKRVVATIFAVVMAFLYLPILSVIISSFNASSDSTAWDGLTLQWYEELFSDGDLLKALQVSVLVGLIASAIATALGFVSALGLTRVKGKGRAFFLGSILLPLILPEIVLGASLLSVFSAMKVTLSIWTVIAGHVVISLPLTTLILLGAMSTLDPSLTEASTDLGCTPWQTFTKVLFPLTRSAVFAAFLLTFTTSFSNIVISTFTSGVGSTTLPLRIYSLLKTGITPEINALGTLLITTTIAIILAVGIGQMRRILVGQEPEAQ
jgi:ABC-type spermidine/putrescine transport system permease subunit II